MKMNIYKTSGIDMMRRSQQLEPGKVFLIGSESVTNSLYFHRKEDLVYAHKVVNQKLSGILFVIDYLFTPLGWILLVKFKSKFEIEAYYNRMHLNKLGISKDKSAEVIISEIIRLAISSIASFVNRGAKRKGALVQKVFKRFRIQSVDVAMSLIDKMKRREVILSNQREHFRVGITKLKIKALRSIGMSFLSSEANSEEEDILFIVYKDDEDISKSKIMRFIKGGLSYKSLINSV